MRISSAGFARFIHSRRRKSPNPACEDGNEHFRRSRWCRYRHKSGDTEIVYESGKNCAYWSDFAAKWPGRRHRLVQWTPGSTLKHPILLLAVKHRISSSASPSQPEQLCPLALYDAYLGYHRVFDVAQADAFGKALEPCDAGDERDRIVRGDPAKDNRGIVFRHENDLLSMCSSRKSSSARSA